MLLREKLNLDICLDKHLMHSESILGRQVLEFI